VLERCDWDARSRAAEALGRIGDPRALAWFVAGLRHPHEVVRLHCTRAIAALGDPRGVEPLCVALGDARASVRRRAALALARLDDPRAPPALAAALRDGDPDVRRFAAEGLIRLGWEPPTWRDAVLLALCSGRSELPGPACAGRVAALCEIVREGDWELRGAAARALTRLAREEPAPELRLALPNLRRVLRWWPADGEEALALLQQAARSIEAATECGKELPRPALAPAPAADALPRPAPGAPDGSKEHAPEQLPVPSAAPRETAIRPRRHRAGRARARMKWGRAAVTCFLQGGWL
jgi:HEAT repeat protein